WHKLGEKGRRCPAPPDTGHPFCAPVGAAVRGSLVPPRHALERGAPASATPEQLDVRVAQDLRTDWIARSHRRTPSFLRLEYLDIERLPVEPLDVKTLCVKM